MRTQISFVSFERIEQAGEEGALMMRLAIAINNLMASDYLFNEANRLTESDKTKDIGKSIKLFLVTIQNWLSV